MVRNRGEHAQNATRICAAHSRAARLPVTGELDSSTRSKLQAAQGS
jgi:hypothetical protein